MAKTKNGGRETEYHVWLWNENMDHVDELVRRRWQHLTDRAKVINAILRDHREQHAVKS
jgi:hypothetical protein